MTATQEQQPNHKQHTQQTNQTTPPNPEEEKLEPIKSYWWPEQSNINIKEVKKGYSSLITPSTTITFALPLLSLAVFGLYLSISDWVNQLWNRLVDFLLWLHSERSFLSYELSFFVLLSTSLVWYLTKAKDIYLLDFAVWSGHPNYKVSNEEWVSLTRDSGFFNEKSVEFQARLARKTGLGDQTHLPPSIISRPPESSMKCSRSEAEEVIFSTLDSLFEATGINPPDIDILVVNCSLFCPTPSLSSMIVNKYKMKQNIRSFNLGGMGCSAGLISIDLAKDLLQTHKNSRALVVSTEIIADAWYKGNEKGMLLQNSLFRCGCAAILLSNCWLDSWRSKYKLLHTVRIHKGASEKAFYSVYQEEDQFKNKGVTLSKDLMDVVGDALKSNMTVLGPLVLPWSEHIKFFYYYLYGRVLRKMGKKAPAPYVPDFKKAFQHFCIHAGGKAIIDGLEQNLKLSPKLVEPSRATLFRYGNTSSSSVWYELAYSERLGLVKSGDKVWQIALGAGFKCNSAVWKALTDIPKVAVPPESLGCDGL